MGRGQGSCELEDKEELKEERGWVQGSWGKTTSRRVAGGREGGASGGRGFGEGVGPESSS